MSIKHTLLEGANRLLRPGSLRLVRLPHAPRLEAAETMEGEFIEWLAAKEALTMADARAVYLAAASRFDGGFGGVDFGHFLALLQDTAQVYYRPTSEQALIDAYRTHGLMHLLRMITYPVPGFVSDSHVWETVQGRPRISILDYGCGVGRYGISLGTALRARGIEPELYFLDIETIRFEFIKDVCRRRELACHFIAVGTGSDHYPALPAHDICVATEVFEHLQEPLRALANIHRSLTPGGLLVTNVTDQRPASMHLVLDLSPLRAQLAEWGYQELQSYYRYRKALM